MNARLFLHQRTVEMEKINYEKSVARLEEIVKLLERGNSSLDESLKLYEEGVSLVRFCNEALNNAEKRIKILVPTSNGEMSEKDFFED